MMTEEERAARQSVIDACLEMNATGLNQGTSGNVSRRWGAGMLITPTSMAYREMAPDDIVYLEMDGAAHGSRRPSSEWRFHRDILAARPEAGAVVHTHSLYATTLAILGEPIPPLHYMIAVAGGHDIRVAPYAIYGSQELSYHVLAALEGRNACLMDHHGVVTLGPTVQAALAVAVEVETLARQYHACLAAGRTPPLLSREQIDAVIEKMRADGYGG